VRHDVGRRRLRESDRFLKIVESHALPGGAELRPFGDAVNVGFDRGLGQRLELVPTPLAEQGAAQLQGKGPVRNLDLRRRPRRKNRKVGSYVLPWRQAIVRRFFLTF
jgi:hypothetical protein